MRTWYTFDSYINIYLGNKGEITMIDIHKDEEN